MTLNSYLDRWLETAAKPRVGPRTFEDYTYLLVTHVRPELGVRRLDTITPLQIQAVYSGMLERGLSARTVRVTHNVLSGALKQAVAWRLLAQNSASSVDLPKSQRREMRAFSPEEAECFRKACTNRPMGLLFAFMLATGMRPGEALALRWRDCDLKGGRVRVTQTLVRLKSGRWEFRAPKTSQSCRSISIPPSLTRELIEHRRQQAKRRLAKGPKWRDYDLVFSGRLGQPLDQHNLGARHFKPILKAAELSPEFRVYDLRHSHATLLMAAGENAKVVAERLEEILYGSA